MAAELPLPAKWAFRLVLIAALVVGVALLLTAVMTDDPPAWWWVAGGVLGLVGGHSLILWVVFRTRYPTPEARQARRAELEAQRRELGAQLGIVEGIDRNRLARQAARHKTAVLRSGVDGTAVVTFLALARGGRGNETEQLVYLELEITVGEATPYPVKTGEYLNAASSGSVSPGRQLAVKVDLDDPQRVAVDWERSLRLPSSGIR